MSELADVFARVLSDPHTGARVTIVSNQPDGISLYGTGTLVRVSGEQIRGDVRSLFSDRQIPIPDLTGPFMSQQPFGVRNPQAGLVALVSTDMSSFRMSFELFDPFNRTFDMDLNLIEGIAYGTSPAIGNNEPIHRAVHLVSLRAIDLVH